MMDQISISMLGVVLLGSAALYLYSSGSRPSDKQQKGDHQEPPVVNSTLPYIGHILGLMWNGQRYVELLSKQNGLPIFTLQIFSIKIYVISSPELIAATDRASKTFTFYPFISLISARLFDVGERTMAIINQNLERKEGQWGLVADTTRGMHSVLSPGPELDLMNETMLTHFLPEADGAADSVVDLFAWVRRSFAVSTTFAIYGPGNPFAKYRDLEEAFWTFDEGFAPIIFGLPTPAGLRAKKARARVIKAMNEYFENGEQEHGLGVIKVRYEAGRRYGATLDDISRFEIGDCVGILVNATPALFWSILHVYSTPDLLLSLRKEIEAHLVTKTVDGKTKHIIDITTLQDNCPLLLSTFRELLRLRTHFSAARWVTEDTILDGQYKLTKGSVIQMPGGVAHANTTVWGADADTFKPTRFLDNPRLQPGSYRAWGGGMTMCPGRFFATMEITSTLALFVARFDVEPADGRPWKMPKSESHRLASSVSPPSTDVKVKISTRAGMEGHQWGYAFGRAPKMEE